MLHTSCAEPDRYSSSDCPTQAVKWPCCPSPTSAPSTPPPPPRPQSSLSQVEEVAIAKHGSLYALEEAKRQRMQAKLEQRSSKRQAAELQEDRRRRHEEQLQATLDKYADKYACETTAAEGRPGGDDEDDDTGGGGGGGRGQATTHGRGCPQHVLWQEADKTTQNTRLGQPRAGQSAHPTVSTRWCVCVSCYLLCISFCVQSLMILMPPPSAQGGLLHTWQMWRWKSCEAVVLRMRGVQWSSVELSGPKAVRQQ